MTRYQQQLSRINDGLLILLAFCLPLSASAITVTALLTVVCWLLGGRFREKYREIIASPVCIAVFVYLSVMLIGLCWTESLPAGLKAIADQWKIWLLPVFLTAVRWERRWWYAAAFIAGVTVTMVLISLAWFDLLGYIGLSSHLSILSNHIVFTPMLAFAIYLLLHQVLWGELRGLQRWLVLVLAGLMVFTVFITTGRAGQIAFFILLTLLLFQYFHRNVLKAAALTLVLLPLVFIVGYRLSPVFQARVDLVRQNIGTFEENPFTSVGLRLLFWKNSREIIKQSPWFGVGTGGFAATYARVNLQRSPTIPPTDNPHNQYIFAMVQQGVLGLSALLCLFFIQVQQAWRTPDGWQRIRLAFPLFFLVIMMTDSYLNTYSSGFLFSLFSAILAKSKNHGQAPVESCFSHPMSRLDQALPPSQQDMTLSQRGASTCGEKG